MFWREDFIRHMAWSKGWELWLLPKYYCCSGLHEFETWSGARNDLKITFTLINNIFLEETFYETTKSKLEERGLDNLWDIIQNLMLPL